MDAHSRPERSRRPLKALESSPTLGNVEPEPAPGAISSPSQPAARPSRFPPAVWIALTGASLTAFGVLGALVVRGVTQSWDESSMRWIDGWATPGLTSYAINITNVGSWSVVMVMGLLATGFLWAHGERRSMLVLWLALLGVLFLDNLFKGFFGRERPTVFEWRIDRAGGKSYPSGHALNATVAYILFAYLVARLRRSAALSLSATLVAAAAISGVAISRVYLGVHYPSDVLGGFLLGCAWVTACLLTLNALEGRSRT
jgi:undecaprenyl-diphosphatase